MVSNLLLGLPWEHEHSTSTGRQFSALIRVSADQSMLNRGSKMAKHSQELSVGSNV